MNDAIRLWFSFDRRVSRQAYVLSGLGLMLLKYSVDNLIFYYGGPGRMLDPIQYLNPSLTLRMKALTLGDSVQYADTGIWFFLSVLWALPFIWIGTSMSVRRAMDAGLSKWLGLMFFVPVVNLLFIVVLSSLPSTLKATPPTERDPDILKAPPHLISSAFKAVALTTGLGVCMTLASVFGLGTYGETLFVGTPFVMGVLAAYLVGRPKVQGVKVSIFVAVMSVLVCAGTLLLLALEGVLCLVMAAPIAIALSALGGLLGHSMVSLYSNAKSSMAALTFALPLILVWDAPNTSALREHAVTTTIEIEAPPESVWPNVVGFSELPSPKAWLLNTGIAIPIRARIEGSGVGAVRYCEFTTGPFIEPITVWDYPQRLAFDVIDQPPSMEEWSPYQVVHAPHLVGGLVSKRGQFKLVRLPSGRTRLEGTTWYTIAMAPQWYWSGWSDVLIHAIHRRVLQHVKSLSEVRQLGKNTTDMFKRPNRTSTASIAAGIGDVKLTPNLAGLPSH